MSKGRSVGTVARSATGSCDGRVSGSGSGDAVEMGVEGTFVRNGSPFRYGVGFDGRVSGSGSGDASDGRRVDVRSRGTRAIQVDDLFLAQGAIKNGDLVEAAFEVAFAGATASEEEGVGMLTVVAPGLHDA